MTDSVSDERQQIIDRREKARQMAMARTKVVNRKKLSDEKGSDAPQLRAAAPKGNMISVTGREANGWQWSPNTVSSFCMVFILAMALLHLFGGKYLPK